MSLHSQLWSSCFHSVVLRKLIAENGFVQTETRAMQQAICSKLLSPGSFQMTPSVLVVRQIIFVSSPFILFSHILYYHSCRVLTNCVLLLHVLILSFSAQYILYILRNFFLFINHHLFTIDYYRSSSLPTPSFLAIVSEPCLFAPYILDTQPLQTMLCFTQAASVSLIIFASRCGKNYGLNKDHPLKQFILSQLQVYRVLDFASLHFFHQ